MQMVRALNEKLPYERRVSEAFWYPGKGTRVISEYARLFPDSTLPRKSVRLKIAFGLSLVLAVTVLSWR